MLRRLNAGQVARPIVKVVLPPPPPPSLTDLVLAELRAVQRKLSREAGKELVTRRRLQIVTDETRLGWKAGLVTIERVPFDAIDYSRQFRPTAVGFAADVLGDLTYSVVAQQGVLHLMRNGIRIVSTREPPVGGTFEFVEPGGCPPAKVKVRRTARGYAHRVSFK